MKDIQKNIQIKQRVTWNQDFLETLDMFLEMIELDKQIEATLLQGCKEKGRFSAAIRFLIKKYVDEHKPSFLLYKSKQKQAKND